LNSSSILSRATISFSKAFPYLSRVCPDKQSNNRSVYLSFARTIRHCPVKAIRFSGNQAYIIDNECILCGHCFVVCPQNAKQIVDERMEFVVNGNANTLLAFAHAERAGKLHFNKPSGYCFVYPDKPAIDKGMLLKSELLDLFQKMKGASCSELHRFKKIQLQKLRRRSWQQTKVRCLQ